MNKLLIIFLTVCIISVHAFVKRDTEPAKSKNLMDDLTKEFEDFSKKMAANFEPDHIKTEFNKFVDNASEFVNKFKPKEEAKQK